MNKSKALELAARLAAETRDQLDDGLESIHVENPEEGVYQIWLGDAREGGIIATPTTKADTWVVQEMWIAGQTFIHLGPDNCVCAHIW